MSDEDTNFSDDDSMENNGLEENEEYESESDVDEEGDVRFDQPAPNAIFNRDGLSDKLQDISWPENVAWIQKLAVDVDQDQEVDVNDDLARELAFYTQALEGTKMVFEKLESMGLPFLRPSDYYAEMVKSDSHMEKVKSRLLAEKRNIEEAEERKKAREAKRLAKEVQAQKLKERAAQKKMEIESVKKWRKQRQQSGFDSKDGEMALDFEDGRVFERSKKKQQPGARPGDRAGGKGQFQKKGNKKQEKKRMQKDAKFGYGGRRGLKKQNTAETTDNAPSFRKGNALDSRKRKR